VVTDGRRYFALIGDLVASRRLEDRAAVQVRFRESVRSMNERLGMHLVVPMKLTAGDEVQALTECAEILLDVVVEVSDAVFPVELSWGVGLGGLTTDLAEDIALLDGPCFHGAREAVEWSKRSSRWLTTRGLPEPGGQVLEGLMNLIGTIRSDWTVRQAEIVREARGRKQVRVAEDLGVDKSTISRTLGKAHYERVLEGEDAVRALLRSVGAGGARFAPEHRPGQ
jgi:hypothetical protein